ncbi:hypothetical protein M9434_002814 [Picochlorum sp. BPE23]|nr:hypothetical protein M9434_002814 [Picochlorum sp. BPE23]
MMQFTITLLLMFFGAYGAAYIPFAWDVSDKQINIISSLGGGLMIGSCLAVVVPEGFASFSGHHDHHDSDVGEIPEGFAGIALVVGFLGMYLLDQMQADHPHGCCAHRKSGDEEEKVPQRRPEKAITGLLIHCIADGVAMGSAFLSGNSSVTLILGTAMVLHKAPMAFGLSSFLISSGWTWERSASTLLLFSSMAPAATVVTYIALQILPLFGGEQSIALAILFSGGTFLHAATMHILPEVTIGRNLDLLFLSIGALAPPLLSWGHSH